MRKVLLIALFLLCSNSAFAAAGTLSSCKRIPANDAPKKDFVWKPSGAHFPANAVVVLPQADLGKGAVVDAYQTNGKKIGNCHLKSSGYCPTSPECLWRPTYLCPLNGNAYQRRFKQIILKVSYPARTRKNCVTRLLKKPGSRID